MELNGNTVVLGLRQCWQCDGTLRINAWRPCPKCKGTGKLDPNKPKGRNCPECAKNSSCMKGQVVMVNVEDCHCTKTETPGQQKENICDTVPVEWIDAMDIKVYRSQRPQGIAENLFASGLYSCVDYGDWQRKTDETLIADVRKHATYVQATKIVRREDMQLCSHIGVFCNVGGYSVMPVFDSAEAVENTLRRQLTHSEGMAIGTKLYNEGLPGSLMVASFLK